MNKVVIIGYGKMAEAILSGIEGFEVEIVGRDLEKLKNFASRFNINYSLIDGYDLTGKIVILAVKPYALEDVAKKVKGKAYILISILAGKKLDDLKRINSQYYIRAMPNVAAKKNSSITVLSGDKEVKDIAVNILNKIGDTIWVENDNEIDIATAIIGSGPAFLALIAEAIEDAGVYLGLKRDVSNILTKGLFKSFSVLDEEFSEIKNSVMSPRGTTAEGIRSLEEDGVRGKIFRAIVKTYEKAKGI